MASKIDMASNALLLLGDAPIASLDEDGAGAQVMSNIYEPTYLGLISQNIWGFARKQAELSQNVASPLFDYQYSYTLPADQLRLIALASRFEYQVYENKLYTDDNAAKIDYIVRPDEGNLPPYFVELMQLQLAANAAMAVTDRANLAAEMQGRARNQYLIAMGADAQNDTNIAIKSSPFIEVRG